MVSSFVLILLEIITILPGVLLFFGRKLLHSVLFLAVTAVGSALIFLYIGQTLVSLLQLLVFVGGLSTYLIVAIAAERNRTEMASAIRFAIAVTAVFLGFMTFIGGVTGGQPNNNSFSSSAETAFGTYYPILFISAFLLFATVMGSILVIKKLSKLVV